MYFLNSLFMHLLKKKIETRGGKGFKGGDIKSAF